MSLKVQTGPFNIESIDLSGLLKILIPDLRIAAQVQRTRQPERERILYFFDVFFFFGIIGPDG